MSSIFICYSRVDKPITEQLAVLLRKSFTHVWYDDNLHGGEEWWAEILREIAACQHFMLLMSDASINSEWCQREMEEALRLNKHIVPVLVRARTIIPESLSRIQHIDMASGVSVEGLNQLYATLIRFTQEVPVARTHQRQRDLDRRLLERLWLFINGYYIEMLNEQLQHGLVDWELYTSHITKYLDLRSKARDHFSETRLEDAFEAFDDALIKLDGQIGWTYVLDETKERPFMVEPKTARDDSYWFQKYSRLMKGSTEVMMRHVELVEAVRSALPNFDLQSYEA